MRRVTRNTTVSLYGSMFVNKWTLLIGMTLYARRVSASREPRLLQLEAAVRIVAVAALHRAFENLVMKRHQELVFGFAMAVQAELRLALFQQVYAGKPGLLSIGLTDEHV